MQLAVAGFTRYHRMSLGNFELFMPRRWGMTDSEPETDLAALAAVCAPALVAQEDLNEVTLGPLRGV
jgi:hypothetical protein